MESQRADPTPDGSARKQNRVKDLCLELERRIGAELMRFKLSQHQQNIATVIIRESIGRGYREVCFPSLDVMGEQAGLAKNDVHPALQSLVNMRIVHARELGERKMYAVNTNTDRWQCAPRRMPAEIARARDAIRRYNPEDRVRLCESSIRGMASELGELIGDGEKNDPKAARLKTGAIVLDSRTVLELPEEEEA